MVRKSPYWAVAVALSVFASLPPAAVAESGFAPVAGSVLTLGDSIELALKNNHQLLAARQGRAEAHAMAKGSYDGFLPQLSFEQSWMSSDNPVNVFATKLNQGAFSQNDFAIEKLNHPDHVDDHMSRLALMVPIFNGGKEYLGVKMAKEGIRKASEMVNTAEESIVFHVTEAFYQATLAREGLALAENAVEVATSSLGLIQNRYDEGLAYKSDLLSARLHLTELKEQREKAANNYRLALLGFNLMLGDIKANHLPDGQLSYTACPSLDPDSLYDVATSKRAELKELESDLAIAQKEVKLARTRLMPTLNAQASYEYHGESPFTDGADNTTVAVGLRVPLFQGTGVYSDIAAKKEKVQRLTYQIAGLREQIRLEVAQAISRITESDTRIALMAETVEQAREVHRLVQARYEEGAATIVELQQAELRIMQAKMSQLQANFDHLVSQARLCRATGQSRSAVTGRLAFE